MELQRAIISRQVRGQLENVAAGACNPWDNYPTIKDYFHLLSWPRPLQQVNVANTPASRELLPVRRRSTRPKPRRREAALQAIADLQDSDGGVTRGRARWQ